MRRPIYAVLAAALLAAPSSLLAQNVIPRPLNSQEDLLFKSGGNVVADWWKSVLIGPYSGAITSGDPTIPQITLYCVDFANGVRVNDTWTANVTDLGAATSDADLTNTRLVVEGTDNGLDNFDSLTKYRQAAFLASLFSSWSMYSNNGSYTYNGGTQFDDKASVYSGIAAAIWSIMTPGFPTSFGGEITSPALAQAMAAPFIQMATAQDLGSMSFGGWSVLTDVVDPGKQEYLVRTSVAPEPQTYVLLLSGLLVLLGVTKLRRREESAGVA